MGNSQANDETTPTGSTTTPLALDLLRDIGAAAPELWFAARYARIAKIPRDQLDEPMLFLRQLGLIAVADWVRGEGQGFALTDEGRAVLANPIPLLGSVPKVSLAPAKSGPAAASNPVLGEFDEPSEVLNPPPALVSPALLVANVLWFTIGAVIAWQRTTTFSEYLKGTDSPSSYFAIGAVSGSSILAGDWWRLASSAFVHIGLLHLLGNMLMLGILGPAAEVLWGRRRFAAIYALAGLGGGIVAVGLDPISTEAGETREIVMAGASGALWGVLASMVMWLLLYRDRLDPAVVADWVRRIILVVMMNLLISLAPGVSLAAHLGGGVFGFLATFLLDRIRSSFPPRMRRKAVLGLLGLTAALPLGLASAMRFSPDWTTLREIVARREAEQDRRRKVPVLQVHGQAVILWQELHLRAPELIVGNERVMAQFHGMADGLLASCPAAERVAWPSAETAARIGAYLQAARELATAVKLQTQPDSTHVDFASLRQAWDRLEEEWNRLGWNPSP